MEEVEGLLENLDRVADKVRLFEFVEVRVFELNFSAVVPQLKCDVMREEVGDVAVFVVGLAVEDLVRRWQRETTCTADEVTRAEVDTVESREKGRRGDGRDSPTSSLAVKAL